jgi:hypothetical protein
MQNVCQSGGARGADLAWGDHAARLGHKVVHFSFDGHRTRAPAEQLVVLWDDELRRADAHLAIANRTLRRTWPPATDYSASLLRRDWHQVRNAERVYAVARFGSDGQIEGGTAWGVTMFIDRHAGKPCGAYLYEPSLQRWLSWNAEWQPIGTTPAPHGIWAGIGTRDLDAAGEKAIAALLAP